MRRFLDRRGDIIRFGNDGWHARFDDGLNEANVVRVADALASLWAEARPGATVYVGFDTRHLSRGPAHGAAAGFYGAAVKFRQPFGIGAFPVIKNCRPGHMKIFHSIFSHSPGLIGIDEGSPEHILVYLP